MIRTTEKELRKIGDIYGFMHHACFNEEHWVYTYLSSAHQEALKKEIERLRQVYEQQNLKMSAGADASDHGPLPPVRAEKELMS